MKMVGLFWRSVAALPGEGLKDGSYFKCLRRQHKTSCSDLI